MRLLFELPGSRYARLALAGELEGVTASAAYIKGGSTAHVHRHRKRFHDLVPRCIQFCQCFREPIQPSQ
jgi:hypothetical protein